MMKHEFESRVGLHIDTACYDRIEYVYTHCPVFTETNGKQEISDFYKQFGMNGIERLYHALREIFTLMNEDKNYSEPWQVIIEYALRLSPTQMDYRAFNVRVSHWWQEYVRLACNGRLAAGA